MTEILEFITAVFIIVVTYYTVIKSIETVGKKLIDYYLERKG